MLRASAWRPAKRGRYPIILYRTPYGRLHGEDFVFAHPSWYASHGFAVVTQDVRGRWGSDGHFDPFVHERRDSVETLEWVASLPFSSGAVGMCGMSYPGHVQYQAAGDTSGILRAIAPVLATPNPFEGWVYNRGAFSLAFNLSWSTYLAMNAARRAGDHAGESHFARTYAHAPDYFHLPLSDSPRLREWSPFYFDWLQHDFYDDYWQARDASETLSSSNVSAYCVGGLHDVFLEGTVAAAQQLRARHGAAETHLRLMPWWHGPLGRYVGAIDFGPEAGKAWLDDELLRFFHQHLHGGDPLEGGTTCFVTGVNRLEVFEEWPPVGREVALHLQATRGANSLSGDGRLTEEGPPAGAWPDRFTYDAAEAVPSLGGRSCCFAHVAPVGPADQRPVEALNGVLVYTGDALPRDLFVAGMARFVLFAATTAVDTDWTVKVCDVSPDEASINVQETILRASYAGDRKLRRPPNECQAYEFGIGTVCHVFKRGHRIRVEISSSNFSHWDRNLNTGNPLGSDTLSDRVTASQTVYRDADHPSRLVLPVVDG